MRPACSYWLVHSIISYLSSRHWHVTESGQAFCKGLLDKSSLRSELATTFCVRSGIAFAHKGYED